jgi:hypothetical protein
MIVRCKRCGETFAGSEMDTERQFSEHTCKGKRDLNELPTDLLGQVATGKMSEEEAFKTADERRKK